MKRKCICCGGGEFIEDVELLDTGKSAYGSATLRIFEDPDALFIKESCYSYMEAKVCAECGYVHFFASDLAELKRGAKTREYNKKGRESDSEKKESDVPRCGNCNTIHTNDSCPKCGFSIKR